jgi:uncharacterized damage-inducible protein DinB
MIDPRLSEILRMLDPEPGYRQWSGGATPLGSLRGVTAGQAAWKPTPERHSIWELTLHIAYWKYAVRRILEDGPRSGFARSPSNWPRVSEPADDRTWREDRALLRSEHRQLVEAARALDPGSLDERAPGSGMYRLADLLHGIVMHDAHHVGQIQLMKRMYGEVQG